MVGSIFVAGILEQRRYRPTGPGFERRIRHREMNLLVGVDGEHHLRTRIFFACSHRRRHLRSNRIDISCRLEHYKHDKISGDQYSVHVAL